MTKNENWLLVIKQFIKFGAVGASNTIIAVLIYNGLLSIGVNYITAYTISFLVSVINAYIWNKRYVFGVKGSNNKPFIRVLASYSSTFLLGLLLLYLLVRFLGVSKQIAQILILCITIPANFLLNKLWAFNPKTMNCEKAK